MKKTLAFWAAVLYSSLVFADHNRITDGSIRIRVAHDYLLLVPVYVNGEGPFDFLLDTGANTTIIDPALAAKLNLKPSSDTEVLTIAGSERVQRSSLNLSWLLEQAPVKVSVIVENLGRLRLPDQRIQGILGSNFLSQFDYFVDLRSRLIRLNPENIPEGERQPFTFGQGRILVEAAAPGYANGPLRFSLDSGTWEVVLFSGEHDLSGGAPQQVAHTVSGSKTMRAYQLKVLTIGSYFAHDLSAAIVDLGPQRQGRLEDGLLPMALFRSVYVCNSQRFVILNAKAGA